MSARSGCLAVWLCLLVVGAGRAGPTAEQVSRYQALDARELRTFSNVELAEYLALRQEVAPPTDPAVEIGRMARKAVGTPFRLNALRFAYDEVDCVVAVERALAMGLGHDWEAYRRVCDRLRHKDGVVAYKARNFSTLGDWLPNNCAWLLEDITPSLPGAESFTHIVRPKRFKDVATAGGLRTVFLGHDWRTTEVEERVDSYVPRKAIPDVLRHLRAGDIVLVIYGVGRRAGCDHMGIIVRDDNGRVALVHAAPPEARVDALTDFVDFFPRISGLKFLRPRPDALNLVTRLNPTLVPGPAAEDAKVLAMREERGRQRTSESGTAGDTAEQVANREVQP